MLIVEIVCGIILAGAVMTYWRQMLMVTIALTMLSSLLLAIAEAWR